ncbi:unnamed protein product [Rhizophagus irregularis]|nr:unnamed protein product [Rhizophagus irregularis]
MMELWIERLNTLSTMYSRLLNIQERTYYNTRISTILQLSDQLNVQIEALQDTNFNGMALSFQPTGAKTIYRRRKEFNIPDDLANYMNITDDQIDNIVKGLRVEHPFFGQVLLMGSIHSLGIRIPRQCLRDSLQRIDTFGILNRWSNIIPRKIYSVAGPNCLWHIDGNNRSDTVLSAFMSACQLFGIPSRIRADKGGENVKVQQYMEGYRGSMMQYGIRGLEDSVINPTEYGIDWNGPIPSVESDTVIVNESGNILDNDQYTNLISRVNPLQIDNCYGGGLFLPIIMTIFHTTS